MKILFFLMLLLVGIWFITFVVHVGIKVVQFYFEIELVITIFGQTVFKRKWQGNWFDRLIDRLKKASNEQSILREDKNEEKIHGIVPSLLRIGRWESFVWHIKVGMNDAMVTAIVAGSIWGLQGIIGEGWIRNRDCMIAISCHPKFGELLLYNELKCIVRFRFGDIIKEFAHEYLKRKRRKIS